MIIQKSVTPPPVADAVLILETRGDGGTGGVTMILAKIP